MSEHIKKGIEIDEEFARSCFEHYHQEKLKQYKSWLKEQIERKANSESLVVQDVYQWVLSLLEEK